MIDNSKNAVVSPRSGSRQISQSRDLAMAPCTTEFLFTKTRIEFADDAVPGLWEHSGESAESSWPSGPRSASDHARGSTFEQLSFSNEFLVL